MRGIKRTDENPDHLRHTARGDKAVPGHPRPSGGGWRGQPGVRDGAASRNAGPGVVDYRHHARP